MVSSSSPSFFHFSLSLYFFSLTLLLLKTYLRNEGEKSWKMSNNGCSQKDRLKRAAKVLIMSYKKCFHQMEGLLMEERRRKEWEKKEKSIPEGKNIVEKENCSISTCQGWIINWIKIYYFFSLPSISTCFILFFLTAPGMTGKKMVTFSLHLSFFLT